jgi:hypothetical protein
MIPTQRRKKGIERKERESETGTWKKIRYQIHKESWL